ncbi:hypothetical protein PVK06_024104 [Gossypium arboreum]|uniref:Uncharacterized protein n=1 Tax=Gossypium arboreum TaxID=29729 RepID=A0ABR0PCX8_GOSAR|nr:hypothetical protein PVK06_024104 [Gossypium arboreum]
MAVDELDRRPRAWEWKTMGVPETRLDSISSGRAFVEGAISDTTHTTTHYSLLHWLGYRRKALAPLSSTYDPSHSKASALPPSLRYLHAILAHTLIGRRESSGVVNTHDAYYLWCMVNAHMTDLAYFIAFAICHQAERHRKGVISIGPYVTCLARDFGLLHTYRLSHAIDEEDLEDIPDDVPPQHEEPSTAPPRERPVHAAASLAHLSDRLAHFEQYYITQFEMIHERDRRRD